MPIYEYQCKAKGHRFEVIQKFSDPPVTKCKKCGAEVEKLISASAFVLKGSGFYVNDYAKKDSGGGKKNAPAKEDKSTSPESTAAPKPDSGESKSSESADKKTSSCATSTCSA